MNSLPRLDAALLCLTFPSSFLLTLFTLRSAVNPLLFQGPRSPSLFGFVRELLGPERTLYAFYDEPELVHDMMEFNSRSIRVPFDKAWLADEADVDRYLAALREAMMKEISAGKRVQI